ncbi:MAG: hypothetical protein J3R72DRAFT_510672 [Linnemannia gamsii]|nr:MAG: hypothetical protein J3R72DRAFT_510672 [Linnemannia gamsii]
MDHTAITNSAQIAELNYRYPVLNVLEAFTGGIPLTNAHPDIENYVPSLQAYPASPSNSTLTLHCMFCSTAVCKNHGRFNTAQPSTYQNGRRWNIGHGGGSTAPGSLGSDVVDVGVIQVRQTIGLATAESSKI